MNIKKQIPNLLTLGNLFCGTIATIFAVQSNFEMTALFVVIGILFDFFDGFVARILKVTGELGTQLDSLADMVTSGVVPGIVMFKLIEIAFVSSSNTIDFNNIIYQENLLQTGILKFAGLLLTIGACYRLAKFNIDSRQTDSFVGLPTPAMCLFVISLPLIQANTNIEFVHGLISNNYFLISITIVLTFLMNAEIPLFSLKFKEYSFKKNWIKYVFLTLCFILITTSKYLSIPMIILSYVVLSLINNKL